MNFTIRSHVWRTQKSEPQREETSIVIHIYFSALHKLFTLACLLFCIGIALEKENKKFIIAS
jgi:hypothetical protein